MKGVTVVNHPLVQHKLTIMRNKHGDTLSALKSGKFDDSLTGVIEKVGADLVKSFA